MTSSEAATYPEDQFLVDFFYADKQRIHTILSQLFPEGYLTGIKIASKASKSTHAGGSGKIPGFAEVKADAINHAEDGIERMYASDWNAPVTFLKEINERGLLHHDIGEAKLGQMVLLSGRLQVLDLGTLRNMWTPITKLKQIIDQEQLRSSTNREMRRNQNVKKNVDAAAKDEEKKLSLVFDLLKGMPDLVQIKIASNDSDAWGNLDPANMLTKYEELPFKYGPTMPGEWLIVGILDALPDCVDNEGCYAATDFEQAMLPAMTFMREFMGRQPRAYGVTPLVIYRGIT